MMEMKLTTFSPFILSDNELIVLIISKKIIEKHYVQ